MKERQRWQPEEDAILRAYVKQHGPKEWNLISQRVEAAGKTLNRDPKSCLERWKNYLKPGIKKGCLTPDEQALVVSLQARYGNKWKKIASEVPGRTAKRLSKWWEVFREKQSKSKSLLQHHRSTQYSDQHHQREGNIPVTGDKTSSQGKYDHILETFAEKYVQPKILNQFQSFPCSLSTMMPPMPDPDPVLSLGSVWMNPGSNLSSSTSTAVSATPSPSVSLSLSPSDPGLDPDLARFKPGQKTGTLVQYCKELEEGRQNWLQHKKEATWRLSRLEQQLESEKARKRREKMEEVEAKIRCLREEEASFMSKIESEYKEQLSALNRDAESKEAKLVEAWCSNHVKFVKLAEQIGVHFGGGGGGHGVQRSQPRISMQFNE